jgi:hypothetical protein
MYPTFTDKTNATNTATAAYPIEVRTLLGLSFASQDFLTGAIVDSNGNCFAEIVVTTPFVNFSIFGSSEPVLVMRNSVVSAADLAGGHHAICSSKNGSKGRYSGRSELIFPDWELFITPLP